MAVWKVPRRGRVSSLTGEPFPPDTAVVTALYGEEEEAGEDRVRGVGFTRRDYLDTEATPERLEGAFCVWRTRTPPEKPEDARRLDLGMAREFLERLRRQDDESKRPVALALALILIRKRRLRLVAEHGDALELAWPREQETFRIPAPTLTEADAEALQQELTRLFDL